MIETKGKTALRLAVLGAGAAIYGDERTTLRDTIVWGNTGTTQLFPATATATYSDIEGGPWSGSGNIAEDPDFESGPKGDYYLESGSPCIDAGSDDADNLGMDVLTTRGDEQRDKGTVDMGYHYYR